MPYITKACRERLISPAASPENPGELNYLITQLLIGYIGGAPNYQKINDVLGALEGAKLEFQRRVVAPYESKKIQENGDVYL